jgi:PAS domain S-box-containing protein
MYSILYVDDEPDLLELGKIYLELSKEFAVETAVSAKEAFGKLALRSFDIIVSDYQMPEMDGLRFLATLRKEQPHLPFIIFTGRGREEIAIEAFEKGADFYLQKGGEPKAQFAELAGKIRIAVDRRRADERVKALNRLYSMLSATNRAIIHYRDKEALLAEICRVVVEIGEFKMAWAGIANTATHRIELVASSGVTGGFLDNIAISTDDSHGGSGPTGTAYRNGVYEICNDIASDPRMRPVRDEALSRGYQALAAFPFARESANSGVLTIYAPRPGFFDEQILLLLAEMSEDITFALMTIDEENRRKAIESELREKNDELKTAYEQITETDEELRQNYDELARGQRSLIESEERYRHLTEAVTDYIFTVRVENGQAVETEHGPGCEAVTGYDAKNFSADTTLWIRMVPEEDRPLVIRQAEEVLDKKHPAPIEHRIIRKDGTLRWVRNTLVPLSDDRGQIVAYDGIIQDITERRNAEEVLRDSEARFRTVIEQSPISIQIMTPEGLTIQVNHAFEKLWGIRLDDLKDYNMLKDAQLTELGLMPYILKGFSGENATIPPALYDGVKSIGIGEKRWVQSRIYPVRDGAGTIRNVILMHEDITEQRKTEEALRASEARYRAFFLNAADGILVADITTHRFIYANPAICRMLGYTEQELTTLHVEDIHPEKDRAFILSEFHDIIDGKKIFSADIPCLRKDKTIVYVTIAASRVTLDQNPCIVGFFADVTERKKIEAALRQTNRQLSLLARITRHDILNNVTIILGRIGIAKDECAKQSGLGHLEKIESATRAIRDQIEFTRIYQDLGAREPQWQDLESVIRKIQVPSRVVLTKAFPRVEIYADLMLERVMDNLIDNSLRHGQTVTAIKISTRQDADSLTIIYEDNGIGIPEPDKEHIFDHGYRNNTGFGLFLVREILSITGITIRENGVPGQGARFEILVPKDAFRLGLP